MMEWYNILIYSIGSFICFICGAAAAYSAIIKRLQRMAEFCERRAMFWIEKDDMEEARPYIAQMVAYKDTMDWIKGEKA